MLGILMQLACKEVLCFVIRNDCGCCWRHIHYSLRDWRDRCIVDGSQLSLSVCSRTLSNVLPEHDSAKS